MISNQEQKDEFERICRGPYIYHAARTDGSALCGQVGGNTAVDAFVNCRKCLRSQGRISPVYPASVRRPSSWVRNDTTVKQGVIISFDHTKGLGIAARREDGRHERFGCTTWSGHRWPRKGDKIELVFFGDTLIQVREGRNG